MQPYQQASEELKRQGEVPFQIAKGATALGASALGGVAAAGIGGRILPFLSKYIPQDLAIKGMSKVDPRLGKFIKTSLNEGFDYNEIRDFIGQKFEESQKPQESKNVIEQYSPELHQFITEQIQSGRSPVEAGALATLERKGKKNFKSVIDKIVADHKAPWAAILETAYGSSKKEKQQQQQQEQGSAQSVPSQSGQNALMDVLNKLSQLRGAK